MKCIRLHADTSQNEQFTPPSDAIVAEWNITYDPSAHGEDGYMNVSYSPFVWPTTSRFRCRWNPTS